MRTLTATHASRGFSDLLDAVENGETVRISRAGHVVAELRPVTPTTGRALREALARTPGMDDAFEDDITAATALLTTDEGDPWRDA
ncbi:type II toxin-antitoxin system Phd/YefM family antitoxin [Cellulomonas bogoriensis]|uniref:Prevent-host-death protein n=1 Tax=Cellulomonas bogoriensis 69B4 = DSM 16987 TaxID=1386082 RepID=A0A0A0BUL7_9CELL|nr:type II toxin-antitoxin system Phd/YefM family antitoxin [Cellulomonas bogoriensis]KGM12103.1 prevent-host-death protein [Cellulomonas bogoriensis 69B4 = DSM 16987]